MRPKNEPALRRVEKSFAIVSVVLLAIFSLGLAHRWIGERQALQSFESQKTAGVQTPAPVLTIPDPTNVSFVDWSEKRVREYGLSLTSQFSDPMAVLRLDKAGIKVPVFRGTDDLTLNRGVGWIPGTARPGQTGNIGIAGHRDGFFRALKDVTKGDDIDLETTSALLRYQIDSIEIVTPDDVSVLAPRGTDSLTLVTCYPFYFIGDAPQRYIVHASYRERAQGVSRP